MQKKMLIIGQGQLGHAYKDYFTKYEEWSVKMAQGIDIRDAQAIQALVVQEKPHVVLNVAALTDIDYAEEHQEECFAVNALGADHVAAACQAMDAYLVHMSSGCVQESKTANEVHTEEDTPNPLCFYAWTKVWAEHLIIDRVHHRGYGSHLLQPLKALILRPRQLLSSTMSPRNALAKMLTYTKFIDMPNSATAIEDLLATTEKLMAKGATGIFNVVNPGIITPYQVACMLRERVRPDMQFEKITKEQLNAMTRAKRIDSVLSGAKLASLGIVLPDIHERLKEILVQLKINLASPDAATILSQVQRQTKEKLVTR